MKINDELSITGDVHLGRKFRNGVPLDRLGERESTVWWQFENELMNCTTHLHVQTGDLFEAFAVEEAVVLEAARIYKAAAYKNHKTTYVVYSGNHDASRDVAKKSSFDVFQALMFGTSNVLVLTAPTSFEGYGFIPWNPFQSSTELAMDLPGTPAHPLKAVFGHWEVQSFGGDDFNLLPLNVLKYRTKTIYTGHIHLPTKFEQDGVTVNVVGSMQPYSHAEDPGTGLYVTMNAGEEVGQDLSTTNVRLLVKGDQQYAVAEDFNCLSLTFKRVPADAVDDEAPDLDVGYDSFDMKALFVDCLKEANVRGHVADKITEKFQELKNV